MTQNNLHNANKSKTYLEVEEKLISELHDYISSYVKSIDLNNKTQDYDDYDCLLNFKCFSEHMIDMYKDRLKQKQKYEAKHAND